MKETNLTSKTIQDTSGPNIRHKVLRPDIQALRALAILSVVICHMNPSWLPGGYLGVDIFFVISGYVITQLICSMQKDKFWFFKFWIKRIFRIVPAYIFMLTIVTTFSAWLLLGDNFSQYEKSWHKAIEFTSNQYFASYGDYFSPKLSEQPLLHTWSLAVEMQFYLIYPLLLWAAIKIRSSLFVGLFFLISFIYAMLIWQINADQQALYYSLKLRFHEFLFGCILCLILLEKKTSIFFSESKKNLFACLGTIVLFCGFVFIDAGNFTPLLAILPCFGVAFIISANLDSGWLFRVFKNQYVLLIGAMSYSIYLWHWPSLAFFRYFYSDISWNIWLILIYMVITFTISWFSWRFIEGGFRLKQSFRERKILVKALVILGFALAPISYATELNHIVPSAPVEFTRYANREAICHGNILASCVRGGVPKPPKILLIGDSHAAQLNLSADVIGQSLNIGIEVITGSNCLPLLSFNWKKLASWAQNPCKKQISIVQEKLPMIDRVILAGMWSHHLENFDTRNAIQNFIQEMRSLNKKVLFLAQIPKFKTNVRRVYRLYQLGIDTNFLGFSSSVSQDWYIANENLLSMIGGRDSISILNLSEDKIFDRAPFYRDVLIYHDSHHLNEIGSAIYGNALLPHIEKWLTENEK